MPVTRSIATAALPRAAPAALTLAYGLPEDASSIIIAITRVVGWLAHAAEQALSDQLIRPRARFVARPVTLPGTDIPPQQ
ncbi:MAG: citrate/2-methylcitrate synthase [Pseudomonadota bacterium]